MAITQERPFVAVTDPTVGFRRRTAALALPLAFVFQLAANSVYAWISTAPGLSDTGSTAEAQALYRAFPDTSVLATVLALCGVLVAIPGLSAAVRVVRPGKPRLSLWAVALMIPGYVCYFGMNFGGFDALALALAGVDTSALDTAPSRIWQLPFFLVFVIGNLGGTLLLGLAAMLGARRSRVPWWSGLLIACWTVGHVINIAGGAEWFAVAGGALEVVGLSILAAAALRLTNAEWVARG